MEEEIQQITQFRVARTTVNDMKIAMIQQINEKRGKKEEGVHSKRRRPTHHIVVNNKQKRFWEPEKLKNMSDEGYVFPDEMKRYESDLLREKPLRVDAQSILRERNNFLKDVRTSGPLNSSDDNPVFDRYTKLS